ncbi:hypothetical protein U4E84_02495 [Halorubrum sp. AD140]|uniref:DUF7344 domain-containing protein n=1 Tax=Halorubrum sp. AD140 TaxID=3050073 RepID=UPI002ACC5088|nr:hypothetical protein [Halorubrum sp. AD140]MDZ5810225.1 hypothetical protein [Halorubrum sp. AD140]
MSVTHTPESREETEQSRDETEPSGPDAGSSAASTEEGRPRPLSLDVIFDVLRNRRRRLVIQTLEERDGETTLSDLAEHIGGIENDKPPNALNAQERKRVYVGLYQCHLPRMDDAGAIDFDKNRGTVVRGPQADAYLTYLEQSESDGSDRRWPTYYAGLAGVSLVAFLLSWALSTGLGTVVLAGSILLILGLSGYHWTARRAD